jgi:hypothetical protein
MLSGFAQAENFSFAVLSTAKEKYNTLCDLCVSSDSPAKRDASPGGEINTSHNALSRKAQLGPSA